MNFNITTKNGATLNTSGKYCPENIGVVPRLQSKTVTENGTITPDSGYCGLEQVVVNVASTATKIITTTTMQTSTLPARTVPALTKTQIEQIQTLLSQGKYVMVEDSNGQYMVNENDSLYNEIRFTYMGMNLGYYIEGNNVIAEEISSGGTHLACVINEVYTRESCSVIWHSAEDNSYSTNDKIFVDDSGNTYTANEVDCYYGDPYWGSTTKMNNDTTYTVSANQYIFWKTKNTAVRVYPCSYYYYYESDVSDDYTELKVTGKNTIRMTTVTLKSDMQTYDDSHYEDVGILNTFANSKNVTQLRFATYRQD